MTGQNPRQIAYSVLKRWAGGIGFAENLLLHSFEKFALTYRDKAFCQELVYGVIRWQALLDWLIKQKVKEKTPPLRTRILIRMGLYQLVFMEKVPPYAAVNETVKLAKSLGIKSQEVAFVNAMLRAFADDLPNVRSSIEQIRQKDPAVGFSHPSWLFKRWEARFGREDAIKLMVWNNTPPPVYARVNTLKVTAKELTNRWASEKVQYEAFKADWIPDGLFFRINPQGTPEALGSFKDGWFYIQDPSGALAVSLLAPVAEERILDLCAAPGGKTSLIAQLMSNKGRICAVDISKRGLRLLRANCERLGITIVDSSDKYPQEDALFDRVLVDVPCSNTGVIRRRVEVRWRISELELARLVTTQFELLCRAAKFVKPGGILVYSTCSIEPEENLQMIEKFLSSHPDFALECARELLPIKDNVDGAFAARLRRKL